jgi:hypothetical protein
MGPLINRDPFHSIANFILLLVALSSPTLSDSDALGCKKTLHYKMDHLKRKKLEKFLSHVRKVKECKGLCYYKKREGGIIRNCEIF